MKTLKNYKKVFQKHWGFHESDPPMCWGCYQTLAVDIHHLIPKGMGGVSKNRLNRIDNLYPLCRPCHQRAHADKKFNEECKERLKEKLHEKEYEESC